MMLRRFTEFYKRHNPEKMDSIEKMLEKYRGKENVLLQKMRNKYLGATNGILPPSGEGPKCFLDIEISGVSVGTIVTACG